MNNFYGNFNSNPIFRCQPHYTYYSKLIDQENPLFLTLHDIDKGFLHSEQKNEDEVFKNASPQDPRTKEEIKQLYYDHTEEKKFPIFEAPTTSRIRPSKHSWGVKVIKCMQECIAVNEEDMCKWRLLERERRKEKQAFQNYVSDVKEKSKERADASSRHLSELYKLWYREQSEILRIRHEAQTYNTHLGMPHTRLCKSFLNDGKAEIIDVKLIQRKGFVLNSTLCKTINFQSLEHSIDACNREYINCQKTKELFKAKLQMDFLNDVNKTEDNTAPILYIPLSALMFLLTAGDYIDLPTEILLRIQDNGDDQKLIIMEEPLPARVCGWHTQKQVMEQSALALLSLQGNEKWYEVRNTQLHKVFDMPEEINSCESDTIEYKLIPIEKYFSEHTFSKPQMCKFFSILTTWTLQTVNSDHKLTIYTPMDCLAGLDEKDSELNIISLKFEYKSPFGCEIFTKYELLREWLRLKLSNAPSITCYRLDVNNYCTLAQEKLTCARLESYILNQYQINPSRLLGGLCEFLHLLKKMPNGQYMLRYNPKFKDKLMLCQPSQEITQNSIHLHDLLNTEPTDLLFINQTNDYLPIADDVCSRIHMENGVLPCTFIPSTLPKAKKLRNQRNNLKTQKQHNDRDFLLKKIAQYKTQQEKLISYRKKLHKKRKRKRKKAAKKLTTENQGEEQAIQEEIDKDQLLFANQIFY